MVLPLTLNWNYRVLDNKGLSNMRPGNSAKKMRKRSLRKGQVLLPQN